MKQFLLDLVGNEMLITAIASWLIAQILKFIVFAIVNKKIDFSRLLGDGGMPSGHSATVSSMATMSFLIYGIGSFEFAIAFMFAIIVMHDAKGVRFETGKQAKVIKEIAQFVEKSIDLTINFSDEKLKEFVGHTPLQVFFGAILGVIVSCVIYFCFL